jgi:hypothetical protein
MSQEEKPVRLWSTWQFRPVERKLDVSYGNAFTVMLIFLAHTPPRWAATSVYTDPRVAVMVEGSLTDTEKVAYLGDGVL